MDVIENQDSNTELVPPQETIQQDVPQDNPEQKETQAEDADWIKNLRRDRKEALRRADEAERKSKMQDELLQRLISQQQPSQPQAQPEEDIISSLAKEEYVAGDKVAKALKQQKEEFKRELDTVKKGYANQQQNSMMNELKREYPDFDQVVNPETLALLEETNPRLANAIASSGDVYNIAVQSYEYIKAKGLSQKGSTSRRADEIERKIEQNKKTVQSPQAYDKRPMAVAFQLTDAMKKELHEEMTRYANQAGMGY